MRLSDDDPVQVPDAEPIAEVSFDSGIESDFAARFEALNLDWDLVREPEPLEAGSRVMIPDFAFDYQYADFRIFFEIMGFWTPEYVEKKLGQLETLEDVEMLVAVDDSLGVGEEIEDRDHRAIPYAGNVRIKDVRDALRRYEDDLIVESAAAVPDELRPDPDIIGLDEVAAEHGISGQALDDVRFPDHERIGQTLVAASVLEELAAELEPGLSCPTWKTCSSRTVSRKTVPYSRTGLQGRVGRAQRWDAPSEDVTVALDTECPGSRTDPPEKASGPRRLTTVLLDSRLYPTSQARPTCVSLPESECRGTVRAVPAPLTSDRLVVHCSPGKAPRGPSLHGRGVTPAALTRRRVR